jgi:hypothetical protein
MCLMMVVQQDAALAVGVADRAAAGGRVGQDRVVADPNTVGACVRLCDPSFDARRSVKAGVRGRSAAYGRGITQFSQRNTRASTSAFVRRVGSADTAELADWPDRHDHRGAPAAPACG